MAAAAQDVFEEHLGVIAALKDNYTRRDDALTVANINNLKDEVAQLCMAREDDVKEVIKGEAACLTAIIHSLPILHSLISSLGAYGVLSLLLQSSPDKSRWQRQAPSTLELRMLMAGG